MRSLKYLVILAIFGSALIAAPSISEAKVSNATHKVHVSRGAVSHKHKGKKKHRKHRHHKAVGSAGKTRKAV